MAEAPETTTQEDEATTISAIASPGSSRTAAIPKEQALEIRTIIHDLSNSLEIIIQTSYLIGTLDLEPNAMQWVGMLDTAVKKAVTQNSELRSYIQTHTHGS